MKTLGYYNGKFDEIENMQIPMNDRVHFFGDGVYDATCSKNHVIYLLEEHVDRFYKSAEKIQIDVPCSKEELTLLLQEMLSKVEGDTLSVYWQVTRGSGYRKHEFPEGKANLWIMIRPCVLRDLKEKIGLTCMEDVRYLYCNIKTLNLIPNVMAAQKAAKKGCFETVFHRGARVTECSHSNIAILHNGSLQTHPDGPFILPGIAKNHLRKACRKLGIPVIEKPFSLEEMINADEILVTSSSNFCLTADSFEGMPVGGKAPELVEQLQKELTDEFLKYCHASGA